MAVADDRSEKHGIRIKGESWLFFCTDSTTPVFGTHTGRDRGFEKQGTL